jgi:hypothetical protein
MRNIHKIGVHIACFVWAVCAGLAGATVLSQKDAVLRATNWMSGNPVMSKTRCAVASVSTFPENGSYTVYIVELSPKGYLILNSDDRLPLLVSFSADSEINLSEDSQNALRAMLLGYCERMEQSLHDMPLFPVVRAMASKVVEDDELYGPFLKASWNQNDPYNLFCPGDPSASEDYGFRTSVGCVQTAFGQVLNFHRWPLHGTGSRFYTDSEGSITGSHNADFSDAYDWENIKAAHSPSDSQSEKEAVAELLYELGVAAESDYDPDGTCSSTYILGSRLNDYFFYEPIDHSFSQDSLISKMEADLRAGFPCVVSTPGHAVVADGLMVESGMTTYHLNMGWGGANNGWYSKDLVPTGSKDPESASSYLDGGITSIRPRLAAFPQSDEAVGTSLSTTLNWILPKRRESEVSQLTVKSLTQQKGTWSSDASEITGMSSGWNVVSAGRSGDCWYSEQSENHTGDSSLLLNQVFVPDVSTHLTFWRFATLYNCFFYVEVSTDNGASYQVVDSAEDPYDWHWSYTSVSLAAYAGMEIRIRFRVDSNGGYYLGTLPGIRLDDLEVTSGDWYDWKPLVTDTTLASDRFSEVTTMWDDCDDFSVFEATSTSDFKDWAVSTTGGVDHCFYKQPGGYYSHQYHLTSRSPITPTASTRLVLRGKYAAVYDESFRVMISTDRVEFSKIWSVQGSVDWSDMVIDLSAYAGQAIYVRLEYYYPSGSFTLGGGVWIDSISTQEVTNPELEGQPVHYTTLTNLSAGSYTLAAVLTDTNAVEHLVGPSFSLVVSGPANNNDMDGDDLPDEWELQYFGGETNANPTAMAANGINTVMEAYIADINPTNPASFFETSTDRGHGFVVSWNSVSGRVYSVHSTSNLLESFQPLETNILWPQNSWTDTVERTDVFYKIDVSLP